MRSVVTAPNHRTLTQQPRRVVLVLDPDRALTLSWLFSGLRSDDHIDTRTVLNWDVEQHVRQLIEYSGEPR